MADVADVTQASEQEVQAAAQRVADLSTELVAARAKRDAEVRAQDNQLRLDALADEEARLRAELDAINEQEAAVSPTPPAPAPAKVQEVPAAVPAAAPDEEAKK